MDDPNKSDDGDEPADPPPASQFDKEDEPFLKRMSKEASAHFGKRITALKGQLTTAQQQATELQSKLDAADGKKLPDSWYEHESAFKLSPQYTEIEKNFQKETAATHFWDEQLEACMYNSDANTPEDAPFQPYEVPGPEGKLVTIDSPEKYHPRHRKVLDDLRQSHYKNQERLSAEGQKLATEFSAKHKAEDAALRKAAADKLPWLNDPKHAYQEGFKTILSKLPPAHKNNPFAYIFAALAVQHSAALAENKALRDKAKAGEGIQEDQRKAGPIPGRAGSKKATAQDVVHKPEDMVGL